MRTTNTILVVSQNLIFLPKIENSAASHGIRVRLTATESKFAEIYKLTVVPLVLIDLEGSRKTWTSVVEKLTDSTSKPKIVAYGPHSDVELLNSAKLSGCDEVLTKGQFNNSLPSIVKKVANLPNDSRT